MPPIMDKGEQLYRIDLKGLQPGKHRMEFPIETSFFAEFGENPILAADLKADVELEKTGLCMRLGLKIEGEVTVACDRCLSDLQLPVEVDETIAVTFSGASRVRDEEEERPDGDIIELERNETELDLSQVFYDYVCLSLPIQKVHEDGECDPDMIERMKEILK